MKQGSEEWLTFRRSRIGASDAAVIMGVSPYKTQYQLWMEKALGVEQKMNYAMKFGRENEEKARKLFEEMTGLIMFGDLEPVVNPDKKWQIASLDGMTIEKDAIVEIKCCNTKDHAIARTGQIPEKYRPQLQHQLSVTGLDMSYYFSYHKGEGIVVKVPRDEDYIADLTDMEEYFYYDHMLGGTPPPMTDRDLVACNI